VVAAPVPQRNWTANQEHSTNQQADPSAYNSLNPSTSATEGNQYDSLNMNQNSDEYLRPYDYIATATQEDGYSFSVLYHN